MQQQDCIFCMIAEGKAPSHKVWEDENHLAFLGIFPNTKGMTVVIPKKHYTSYVFDLPEDVMINLMKAARAVGKLLDSKMDTSMRTALVFEGFGVNHVHAKLYPLHGDKSQEWKPIEKELDKFFEEYEGYVSTHEHKRADDKELAELAQKIRE